MELILQFIQMRIEVFRYHLRLAVDNGNKMSISRFTSHSRQRGTIRVRLGEGWRVVHLYPGGV